MFMTSHTVFKQKSILESFIIFSKANLKIKAINLKFISNITLKSTYLQSFEEKKTLDICVFTNIYPNF